MKCLLALVILYSVFGCNGQYREKEIFYIPDCFIGRVSIIHNDKNGSPKEYINGARLYRIPENGVLYTEFRKNTGWVVDDSSLLFFYCDSSNSCNKSLFRIDLLELDSIKKIDGNTVVISNFGYSVMEDDYGDNISVLRFLVDSIKNSNLKKE